MAYRPGVKIVKRGGKTLDKFEESVQQVNINNNIIIIVINSMPSGYTRVRIVVWYKEYSKRSVFHWRKGKKLATPTLNVRYSKGSKYTCIMTVQRCDYIASNILMRDAWAYNGCCNFYSKYNIPNQ